MLQYSSQINDIVGTALTLNPRLNRREIGRESFRLIAALLDEAFPIESHLVFHHCERISSV